MNLSDTEIEKIARKQPRKAALLRACKTAGSPAALARKIRNRELGGRGISHQAVFKWIRAGECPDDRAEEIERLTGVHQGARA